MRGQHPCARERQLDHIKSIPDGLEVIYDGSDFLSSSPTTLVADAQQFHALMNMTTRMVIGVPASRPSSPPRTMSIEGVAGVYQEFQSRTEEFWYLFDTVLNDKCHVHGYLLELVKGCYQNKVLSIVRRSTLMMKASQRKYSK
ncbi:hypothetical protein D9613_012698 [Agrocybe pediades]|uniref:Uncharacterized protein n=1 Tax=Agrocybe pediades TaxID=84607 RepID=A0A8H4VLT4_9AGAR|nr:hypothetical protein D9613_012698 [Agrocybe pediades]